MTSGFYAKLAAGNIRKNRRFYIPHMLTGAGLLAGFYIVLTLTLDRRLSALRGGDYIPAFMGLGSIVIALLTLVLLLYTNSFLMKQRTREFGLYNILGMEKRHVSRVLWWETLLSGGGSILLGIVLGMLFYKLCALLICRLLQVDSVFGFYYIRPIPIGICIGFFLVLYLVTFGINCLRIRRMKPVELLQSQHTGEREPKIKWLLLIVGLLSLAGGYGMSLSANSAYLSIELFFPAVLLVILGTYCLFITGTIAVLKLLKRSKRFYYHPQHMPAVSGLLYRMKQNAVGLASISILATMVLVMLSCTISLYASIEDLLTRVYPHELYLSADYDLDGTTHSLPADALEEIVRDSVHETDAERLAVSAVLHQKYLECAYNNIDGTFSTDRDTLTYSSQLVEALFLTCEEYNALTGEQQTLAEDEILVCPIYLTDTMTEQAITVGGKTYAIREQLSVFPVGFATATTVQAYGIVLPSEADLSAIYREQLDAYGENASSITERVAVDFTRGPIDFETGQRLDACLSEKVDAYVQMTCGTEDPLIHIDSLWDSQCYVYGLYGSMLFLGVILGIVFLFATALIIYYKQISEGYEDRSRFQIMESIGMSQQEVQKTIHTQILLVFFLPLIVSAIHLLFAIPMLRQLLYALLLSNNLLFFLCSVGVFLGFCLVYIVIYSLTARTYYRIVH